MKVFTKFGSALATISSLALVAGFCVIPRESQAYCLIEANGYLDGLGGAIPVWINESSTNANAAYVGLTNSPGSCSMSETALCTDTKALLIEWTKVAIDEVNIASHGGPKLYYAGLVAPAPNFPTAYQEGITIESYRLCAEQADMQPTGGAAFAFTENNSSGTKVRIQLIRGGPKACPDDPNDPEDDDLADYYWWVNPAEDDDNKASNHDLVGTLVHEFGHALGLNHPDYINVVEEPICDGPTSDISEAAVMHYDDKDFRRRLRRDDIEGLRALWGEPGRSLYSAKNDTAGAPENDWDPHDQVGSLVINTPPTASNASRSDEQYLQVASTNAADEVFYLLASSSSVSSIANYITDGSGTSGNRVHTYDPVAIARGSRLSDDHIRLAMAWVGGPDAATQAEGTDPDDPDSRIWWKVWSSPTGWLTPRGSGATKYKEVGLSYDPVTDLFVLVQIDTCRDLTCSTPNPAAEYPSDSYVYVRTISGSTGLLVCTRALTTAGHVLHVGGPACDVRTNEPTQCHIPVVTTGTTGPTLRVLQGTIDEYSGLDCWVSGSTLNTSEKSYGPLWMAMNAATSNGVALVSHVKNPTSANPDNYAEIFVMSRGMTGLLTGSITERKDDMMSDYWPIAVGSLARTSAPNTVWWAVTGY